MQRLRTKYRRALHPCQPRVAPRVAICHPPENPDLASRIGARHQALVAVAPKTSRKLRRRHKCTQPEAIAAGHQARRHAKSISGSGWAVTAVPIIASRHGTSLQQSQRPVLESGLACSRSIGTRRNPRQVMGLIYVRPRPFVFSAGPCQRHCSRCGRTSSSGLPGCLRPAAVRHGILPIRFKAVMRQSIHTPHSSSPERGSNLQSQTVRTIFLAADHQSGATCKQRSGPFDSTGQSMTASSSRIPLSITNR